jgi:RHS repeat-associated protein
VNERVTGAGAVETAYSFDVANNRETMVKHNLTTQYTYNSLNQLLSFTDGRDTTNYIYDVHGNRRTRTKGLASTLYAYDWENRLVEVAQDGTTYAYAYDYRTRRVQRNEGGDTTRVVFSGGTSYAEYTNGVTPSVEYIRGNDYGGGIGGILYSLRPNPQDPGPARIANYAHYNSRGDITANTDDSGTVTYQALYEAFGQRTVTSGSTADRQKANTKEEDPTGLLNEGFRYRDLETGTFVTRDPLGFIDGPNLYAYVRQNPWSSFDPNGVKRKQNRPSLFFSI